jgi:hypothetical protein
MMGISDKPQAVNVHVLYTEDCPATPPTIALIHQAAAEMSLSIQLQTTLVSSPEQASELRFLGSPTILVNGLDIDPSARSKSAYGFM